MLGLTKLPTGITATLCRSTVGQGNVKDLPLPTPSMHSIWTLLSELGDSSWLLPSATLTVLAAGLCGWLSWPIVGRWTMATGLAAVVVLASKVAFMGWGIGSAALDFTGFSGHAAMAAAVYPALLGWFGQALDPRGRLWPGAVAGLLLAALIGISRLPLQAHSLSEVALGWLLGAAAVAWPLHRPSQPMRWSRIACLLAAGLVTALLVRQAPLPSSHRIVEKIAQTISGHDQLHRRWRL